MKFSEGGEGEEEGEWKGEDGEIIGLGSNVNFVIKKIHHLEGVVSIEGELIR